MQTCCQNSGIRGTDLSTRETEEWWADFSVINKGEHVRWAQILRGTLLDYTFHASKAFRISVLALGKWALLVDIRNGFQRKVVVPHSIHFRFRHGASCTFDCTKIKSDWDDDPPCSAVKNALLRWMDSDRQLAVEDRLVSSCKVMHL